ncbi:MAG: PD-(D/E)XK nuclease family protein [Frankiaceae bacterium]|nr:PD-(D/E)XK nuclease family protein [Frankiaceae bacterium]MBV9369750.1 PD-(D/E)XK nuclease family protein [Frankiales bacterium]
MPARLFACTPSRLATWLDCPRRYKFVYVDRPQPAKGPPWAHNSVGASVHAALAAWWALPVERRTPTAAGALLRSKWIGLGFRDDEQAAQWRERAVAMVSGYVERLDPYDEPVGVERTVAMRTEALAFSGRIDRLDRRGDELVVVDYKTGRHVLTTDDARGSLALALYAAAAARTLRRRCLAVELHHLPTGRVVRWEHTQESLDRQLRRAHDIAAEAAAAPERIAAGEDADAVYPPRPGPMCGWCDFAAHCPQGQAAVTAPLAPWAGLAEDIAPLDDDE